MFRFGSPEYLNLLFVIPLLVLFFIFYLGRKKKLLQEFSDKNLFETLFPDKSFKKETFRFLLITISLSLMILALAKPQLGAKIEEVKQVGIEVFICLDVSNSMNAQDLTPNRMQKAKNEISGLIRKLQGDKIGLIIFAGQAFVQFPLTTDYSAANLFLSAVDAGSVPQQGTAIAAAINLSLNSFDYNSNTQKVIVIISDGEDHEGNLDEALKNAREKNVLIYTIGMGSPAGAPIPVLDGLGRVIDFKKDAEGNTILTKLDEVTMKRIADESGGKYYLSSGFGNELDLIYKDLSQLEKSEFGTKKITEYDDKYYYFLIPALILLFIEFFMNDRKSIYLTNIFEKIGLSNKESVA